MFERTQYKMGKDVFYIQQIPPLEALDVLGEVQKVLLPAIGGAMIGSAASSGAKPEETGVNVLYMIMDSLPQHLDGATLKKMEGLLLDSRYIAVKVEGKGEAVALDEDVINELFTGRTLDLIALMFKVFEINFGDFSKLCGVPAGVRRVLETVTSIFQGGQRTASTDVALSTER